MIHDGSGHRLLSNLWLNPSNTGHSPNVVSLLVQRQRRWANIETALGECLVFARLGSRLTL